MGPGVNDLGASRGHIMDSVSRSLERLGTDHIDLYQIHATDAVTPVEETMRALEDLTRQGMVRYVGCSNWQAWRVMKANGYATAPWLGADGDDPVVLLHRGRDLEREIVPMIDDQKVGLMVWSPLAGGLLSGKFGRAATGRRARAAWRSTSRLWTRTARGNASTRCARSARSNGVSVARVAVSCAR